MANGQLYTVPAAKQLHTFLDPAAFQLCYDHGAAPDAQQIVVWYGKEYAPPFRLQKLAHLDMAVIQRNSSRVLALIEIEDTTDNTKTLVGDLLVTLFGSGIAIGQQTHWTLGPWTAFIVFAHVATQARQQAYQRRFDYLQAEVSKLLPHIETNNAKIGRVILDSFVTQTELDDKLRRYLHEIIQNSLS